jgi:allantoinase
MSGAPGPATEHAFYGRDATHDLPPMAWPGDKPLAVALLVSVESYDLYAPAQAFTPGNVPGGMGRGPYPDFRAFSMREYGNRVGFFRVLDALDRHGFRASLAADAGVASRCPEVVRAALDRGWDLVGHGLSVTEALCETMAEDAERDYIARSLAALRGFGAEVAGWHGIEYAQSSRTLPLLAAQGVRYMLDWPHDERVVPMATANGPVLSLPMSADLDDVMAHWHRKIAMGPWVRSVLDAVDQLASDGRTGGRLLVLNLHPWLTGQPYRSSYLAELLAALAKRDDVWFSGTDAIAAHAARRLLPGADG